MKKVALYLTLITLNLLIMLGLIVFKAHFKGYLFIILYVALSTPLFLFLLKRTIMKK